jgi:cellulose synthase/poly-beta-1,6-N-acetylglucosamine synthase-like glycosyltransferase
MIALQILFWVCAALLVWTHAAYPLAVAGLARLRPRPVRRGSITPPVTLVVAAHDEADTIAATLAGLLALDYPEDRLAIVVASDGSTDGTDELVERLGGGGAGGRCCAARARAR